MKNDIKEANDRIKEVENIKNELSDSKEELTAMIDDLIEGIQGADGNYANILEEYKASIEEFINDINKIHDKIDTYNKKYANTLYHIPQIPSKRDKINEELHKIRVSTVTGVPLGLPSDIPRSTKSQMDYTTIEDRNAKNARYGRSIY